jgi:hypothetical protein
MSVPDGIIPLYIQTGNLQHRECTRKIPFKKWWPRAGTNGGKISLLHNGGRVECWTDQVYVEAG